MCYRGGFCCQLAYRAVSHARLSPHLSYSRPSCEAPVGETITALSRDDDLGSHYPQPAT
jgi:hypothetical protein